nr:YgiQ family radical SAM protein [Maliibacterium massiliense]
MSPEEMHDLGWDRPDFCLVTGDAYIDHPSFGAAIIGRALEAQGFQVVVIAQPDWRTLVDFQRFGRPRLGFLVTSGNIDSMVCHYSVGGRRRKSDAYTPGGRMGKRPDRATIVYCNQIRKAYRRMPIIIGGIEASLRRFAHYDYWDNTVRRSILVDSGADLLVYGMAERSVVEVARRMHAGERLRDIRDVPGTAYLAETLEGVEAQQIDSFETVKQDKRAYARAFLDQQRETDGLRGRRLAQPHGAAFVVVNPPAPPLSTAQLDASYDLPYMRAPHPSYKEHIPAMDEVSFSITSCRGCYGGCSFCALTYHQGRTVQARSHASILREARQMTQMPGFKGYIHDVGGPTANFRQPACKAQLKRGVCADRACLWPRCPKLEVTHSDYRALLAELRKVPGVKKVFVRSGLRFDYIMYDKDAGFLRDLVQHHISGQLKVAPEHVDDTVLHYMGKPPREVYDRFLQRYRALNAQMGREQYIVPYFMSSHPGSDLNAAIALACYMKETGQRPEQVQDFYPTPGTLSTTMFYTGLDPRDGKPVYVPRDPHEKRLQRALLQFYMPENAPLVREALRRAARDDLIGSGKRCLVPAQGAAGPRRACGDKRRAGAHAQKQPRQTQGAQAAWAAGKRAPKAQDARAGKQTGKRQDGRTGRARPARHK